MRIELFMDGPNIFNFTLDVVPKTMDDVLAKNGLMQDDIDLYEFHQANKFGTSKNFVGRQEGQPANGLSK